jgi:hypothetical protein
MPDAGHDQEGRLPECFELGHLRLAQGNRAEDGEAARIQPHYRHTPRQFHERHFQLADHGEHAFVDARQVAVRQYGPFFERRGHARMKARP